MYFVDRNKIEQALQYMETVQAHLNTMDHFQTFTDKLALERIAYVVIESIIDVGNSMIDGFIMRDPGSYEDIIDILEDEKVVPADVAKGLKEVIFLRKDLVREYTDMDHEQVYQVLQQNMSSLSQFTADVRRYLVEELGPVSAFLPESAKS